MGKPDSIDIPPALESWLDEATRGIGTLGKTRIREEVSAHFREAYDAALADGVKKEDAEQRAVEALGDARKARRAYWRAYLTVSEEQWVYKLTRDSDRLDRLAIGGLFYLLGGVFLGLHLWSFDLRHDPGGFLMMGAPLLLLGLISLLRANLKSVAEFGRFLVWGTVVSALYVVVFLYIAVRYGPLREFAPGAQFAIPALAVLVLGLLLGRMVARKLGPWVTDEGLRHARRGRFK